MTAFNTGVRSADGTFDNMIEVSQGTQMVTDGPLGRMYTSALNQLYAKEVDPATGMALETQALDAQTNQGLWLAAKAQSKHFADKGDGVGMLYGVYRHEVQMADVINVADAFSEMTEAEKENSVIILDTKIMNDGSGGLPLTEENVVTNPFVPALEALCLKHGVRTAPSLEAYLLSIKKE